MVFPLQNGSAITRTSNVSGIGNGIYASSVPRTGPSDTRVIAGEQSLVFGFINGLLPSVRYDGFSVELALIFLVYLHCSLLLVNLFAVSSTPRQLSTTKNHLMPLYQD